MSVGELEEVWGRLEAKCAAASSIGPSIVGAGVLAVCCTLVVCATTIADALNNHARATERR